MIKGWDTKEQFVYNLKHATRRGKWSYFTWLVINTPIEYHSHEYWEITYILEGNANHYLNGNVLSLTRGDAFILRPHDKHCLSRTTPQGEKYLHRDLYVPVKVMQSICECISPSEPLYQQLLESETPPQFHISHTKRQTIEQTATLLHREQNISHDVFFRSTVIELLSYFLSLESFTHYPTWIINLINRIKRDTSHQKTISDFVASTGYSHPHVCREFKKYTGERLNEFITKNKLEYSTALLVSTPNSIADIAYQVGFSSESNYIACFKRYFNITPHQWRLHNLK